MLAVESSLLKKKKKKLKYSIEPIICIVSFYQKNLQNYITSTMNLICSMESVS